MKTSKDIVKTRTNYISEQGSNEEETITNKLKCARTHGIKL